MGSCGANQPCLKQIDHLLSCTLAVDEFELCDLAFGLTVRPRLHDGGANCGGGGDYPVGYGRPPVATRFRRGRSGNPNGRPRKPKTIRETSRRRSDNDSSEDRGEWPDSNRDCAGGDRPQSCHAAARRDLKAINTLLALRQRVLGSTKLRQLALDDFLVFAVQRARIEGHLGVVLELMRRSGRLHQPGYLQ